jgi:hypothetical protein
MYPLRLLPAPESFPSGHRRTERLPASRERRGPERFAAKAFCDSQSRPLHDFVETNLAAAADRTAHRTRFDGLQLETNRKDPRRGRLFRSLRQAIERMRRGTQNGLDTASLESDPVSQAIPIPGTGQPARSRAIGSARRSKSRPTPGNLPSGCGSMNPRAPSTLRSGISTLVSHRPRILVLLHHPYPLPLSFFLVLPSRFPFGWDVASNDLVSIRDRRRALGGLEAATPHSIQALRTLGSTPDIFENTGHP